MFRNVMPLTVIAANISHHLEPEDLKLLQVLRGCRRRPSVRGVAVGAFNWDIWLV